MNSINNKGYILNVSEEDALLEISDLIVVGETKVNYNIEKVGSNYSGPLSKLKKIEIEKNGYIIYYFPAFKGDNFYLYTFDIEILKNFLAEYKIKLNKNIQNKLALIEIIDSIK